MLIYQSPEDYLYNLQAMTGGEAKRKNLHRNSAKAFGSTWLGCGQCVGTTQPRKRG